MRKIYKPSWFTRYLSLNMTYWFVGLNNESKEIKKEIRKRKEKNSIQFIINKKSVTCPTLCDTFTFFFLLKLKICHWPWKSQKSKMLSEFTNDKMFMCYTIVSIFLFFPFRSSILLKNERSFGLEYSGDKPFAAPSNSSFIFCRSDVMSFSPSSKSRKFCIIDIFLLLGIIPRRRIVEDI